jgi:hypothetical protein
MPKIYQSPPVGLPLFSTIGALTGLELIPMDKIKSGSGPTATVVTVKASIAALFSGVAFPVVITAPAGTVGLTINGATGQQALVINGDETINAATGTVGLTINGAASQDALVVAAGAGATFSAVFTGAPVSAADGMSVTGAGLTIGAPTGGGEGVGTVNATGYFLNGVSIVQSGTFTGTVTGVTTTVTGTMTWVQNGNEVTIYSPAGMSGTSNSTSMTMTGLPSALQPVGTQIVPCSLEDNSANVLGAATVSAGGTITFSRSVVSGTAVTLSATGFTASATKGLNETQFTYSLK